MNREKRRERGGGGKEEEEEHVWHGLLSDLLCSSKGRNKGKGGKREKERETSRRHCSLPVASPSFRLSEGGKKKGGKRTDKIGHSSFVLFVEGGEGKGGKEGKKKKMAPGCRPRPFVNLPKKKKRGGGRGGRGNRMVMGTSSLLQKNKEERKPGSRTSVVASPARMLPFSLSRAGPPQRYV